MKILATHKGEQNRAAVDPWTLVHFSFGLALGLMNARLAWSMGVAAGYEVVEQVFERREWGKRLFQTSGPESLPNALVDLVVFHAGHRLGTRWNETLPPERWHRRGTRMLTGSLEI